MRIDSGDLLTLGREVRRILDEAGFHNVQIVGSGGLDEFDLEELSRENAPYDAYGVGTKMGVSGDAPWTDMAYKLVRYDERPVLKLSTGKVSLPDAKQVFRFTDDRRPHHDILALHDEMITGGEPLLKPVMAGGHITAPLPSLREIREQLQQEFGQLDEKYKMIRDPATYPVSLSAGLQTLKESMERRVETIEVEAARRRHKELGES
ncbi:MAG: hypothetical protein Q8Q07_01085 [Dehalococcoidales bacterium]|nr:hypothetical protein [Dehalococcoidales bacterium]